MLAVSCFELAQTFGDGIMLRMKVVTAGIINRESHFLVARRAANQKLPGFWEFPGGKVESGETLQACLERELLEELGVSAVAGGVLMGSRYDYEHGAILLVAIQAELLTLDFQLTVHDEIRWVLPGEMLQLQLAPADIPIAKFLMGDSDDA
jgi:8-oxo-dGTP diphosphatase